MSEDGYTWWIKRMKRAFDLYDEFRIDHFRGLAAYWAIPAGRSMESC
jgi:4-alpha-glucanotransferase